MIAVITSHNEIKFPLYPRICWSLSSQVSLSLLRRSAAAPFLSFPLCFILSLSSSSQLLLYFTVIKPGNFNQVAKREFLLGQERKSELLFNVAVLSFLLSTSISFLFSAAAELNLGSL